MLLPSLSGAVGRSSFGGLMLQKPRRPASRSFVATRDTPVGLKLKKLEPLVVHPTPMLEEERASLARKLQVDGGIDASQATAYVQLVSAAREKLATSAFVSFAYAQLGTYIATVAQDLYAQQKKDAETQYAQQKKDAETQYAQQKKMHSWTMGLILLTMVMVCLDKATVAKAAMSIAEGLASSVVKALS